MPVQLGFLSTGAIADTVARSASSSPKIAIVAIASRSRERAEAFASRHNVPRAYGAYERLIADPEVEAVYIPLPNSLHVEWSIRALRAGKHVLCEKPFSKSSGGAAAAYATADREGRVLAEGFMYRHNPWIGVVQDLLATGRIGSLRLVRSFWTAKLRNPDYVALRPELHGGVLMALGCYCVSASRLFGGEPIRVYGEQVLGSTGVDISFFGSMRTAEGVFTQFHTSFALPERHGVELTGSDGCVSVLDPWYGRDPVIDVWNNGRHERISPPAADPYRLELEAFARAIHGDAPPVPGREETVKQAMTMEALARSAATSQPVRM